MGWGTKFLAHGPVAAALRTVTDNAMRFVHFPAASQRLWRNGNRVDQGTSRVQSGPHQFDDIFWRRVHVSTANGDRIIDFCNQ